ncbi:MAG: hypothetical protein D6712_18470 [Chloroflexi bacterium]|nr:MAG: hypothetical protein D6712_18470 [Chloroflexota bacterium]
MDEKHKRRPVIDPLLLALRSRRVLVALVGLALGLLTALVPELAAVRDELLTLIVTLALALIGGYSLEDAAVAARQQHPPEDLRALVREVMSGVLDELGM